MKVIVSRNVSATTVLRNKLLMGPLPLRHFLKFIFFIKTLDSIHLHRSDDQSLIPV